MGRRASVYLNILFYVLIFFDAYVAHQWRPDFIILMSIYFCFGILTSDIVTSIVQNNFSGNKNVIIDFGARTTAVFLYVISTEIKINEGFLFTVIVLCIVINICMQYIKLNKELKVTKGEHSEDLERFSKKKRVYKEYEMKDIKNSEKKLSVIFVGLFLMNSTARIPFTMLVFASFIINFYFIYFSYISNKDKIHASSKMIIVYLSAFIGLNIVIIGTLYRSVLNNYEMVTILMIGVLFWSPYILEREKLKYYINAKNRN